MDIDVRKEFPFLSGNTIYLDNASTALKPNCVLEEIKKFYTEKTANAYRGSYENSEYVSMKIDQCRELVGLFLGCSSSEIIFTMNCTDSINQLAKMLDIKKSDNVVCSVLEHHSNLLPWINNANVIIVDTLENGIIDLDALEDVLKNNLIKIVTVTALSNVTGNIQPIKEISELAHKYNALVNVDCCQYAPHKKIDVKEIGCDFLTFSGHKVFGPSGIGILYGKKELLYRCQLSRYGGGMVDRITDLDNIEYKEIPYCFEAGTPPIESILGLAEAIKFLMKIGYKNIEQKNRELNGYFMEKLAKSDTMESLFPIAKEHMPIFTFKIKGNDINVSYIAKVLSDSADISVSVGYQCCQLLYKKYGLKGGIRVSFQFYNTFEEIDRLFEVLDKLKI